MLGKLVITVLLLWATALSAANGEPPLRLVTLEYPPYIKQTGNEAQGLTVDIVKEAFARIGKPIAIEFYPWKRSLSMLAEGKVDGLFTIKKTLEREASMLFPRKALISQDYVFFVRKGSKIQFNGNFVSLADASIGVVNATSYGANFDEAAQSGRFKKLDIANNYDLTFRKLLGGRVDAVICSRLVGLDILKNMNAADKVEISGPPTETTVSYLVFSMKKNHSELSATFDLAIESMEKDGSIGRIFKKYNALMPTAQNSQPRIGQETESTQPSSLTTVRAVPHAANH